MYPSCTSEAASKNKLRRERKKIKIRAALALPSPPYQRRKTAMAPISHYGFFPDLKSCSYSLHKVSEEVLRGGLGRRPTEQEF